MDISQLKKINDYCWTKPRQPHEQRADVCFYGSETLIREMDDKVLEQITNVSRLPGLVGMAMAMPDAHWGYGFPIGGVAAFDPEEGGIISAGGVGFDISCGIRCLRTNLNGSDVHSVRQELSDLLFHTIPAGVGREGPLKLSVREIDRVLINGAQWAVKAGFGNSEDLLFVEEGGQMPHAEPDNVSELAKKRQHGEMGTLGSGNHYLEVQVVHEIFDREAAAAFGIHEGQVLIPNK